MSQRTMQIVPTAGYDPDPNHRDPLWNGTTPFFSYFQPSKVIFLFLSVLGLSVLLPRRQNPLAFGLLALHNQPWL